MMEAIEGLRPDFWALHSSTGAHVGLWDDPSIPEGLVKREYPNGTITPLYRRSPDTGMVEALTPSAETKAAYIGEFHVDVARMDEAGDGYTERIAVPWTTIKEIMAAIRARALSQTGERG